MQLDELILVVTEDLKTIKTEHLALLFYLCNRVTQGQKQQVPTQVLDLQAILAVELFKRGVDVSKL